MVENHNYIVHVGDLESWQRSGSRVVGDNFNMVWGVGVAAGDWKNAVMISIHITKAADGIAGNKLKETNY